MNSKNQHRRAKLPFQDRESVGRRRLLLEKLEDRRVLAASFPVNESFEVADFASLPNWTSSSTGSALVEIEEVQQAHSGAKSLGFRQTVDFQNATAQATLEVDLSTVASETDLSFDFWLKRLTASSNQTFV